jgi:MFS family permease
MDVGFWMDEGLSVGISSHHLGNIPSALRHDGSPPLYYLLLSVWMGLFGRTEADTHLLSLVVTTLTIPFGLWAGWKIYGRRAGLMSAALAAGSVFLTQYAQETRMYGLMALLSFLTAAFFVLAFVGGQRRFLIAFSLSLTAMLYTHGWGILFGIGCGIALLVLMISGDLRRLLIDGALSFGAAAVLFLPWLPTLLFQAAHTGAPWTDAPKFGLFVQLSSILGGKVIAWTVVIGSLAGVVRLIRQSQGPSRPQDGFSSRLARRATISLLSIMFGTLAVAWALSQVNPAWSERYMAAILGPLLLLVAAGFSRTGWVGLVSIAVVLAMSVTSSINIKVAAKGNMRELASEVRRQLRPGDLVINGQPEQTPVAWYYLPAHLRFADPMGRTFDPRMLNWADAVDRMKAADPAVVEERLVARQPIGSRILMIRPLTLGTHNWSPPWTNLVRLRSAQLSGLIAADRRLSPTMVMPWFYSPSSLVADTAVLYEKVRASR